MADTKLGGAATDVDAQDAFVEDGQPLATKPCHQPRVSQFYSGLGVNN
jgi:hypothetical protein